jgi:hypothetical protein
LVKTIDRKGLEEIVEVVRRRGPDGVTAAQIAAALSAPPPSRTLQFRLRRLVDQKRLLREGVRRGVRYRVPRVIEAVGIAVGTSSAEAIGLPLSGGALAIERYVRQPLAARQPVGYDRTFLDLIVPTRAFTWPRRSELACTKSARPGSRRNRLEVMQSRSSVDC